MTTWERIAGPAFAALLMLTGILMAVVEAPDLVADAMSRLRALERER
jgi:hypothetical protein